MSVHELDERALRRLVGLCAVLAGPAAAEDLAQDTLVAALRSPRAPNTPEALDGWLTGVARNVVRRHWRARARDLPLAAGQIDIAAPTDAHDETADRREHLTRHALERLPVASRSLITARDLAGHGTDELAAQLRISPGAVSMRLTRARSALRALITDELGDEARAAGLRIGLQGWRRTPLWCTDCGNRRLDVRRTEHVIAFRCLACAPHPDAIGSAFRLGNRTFAHLLGGITQPAAVARRGAAWSHDYFNRAGGSGQAPCTACGHLARMVPYRRSVPRLALRHRLGLQVICDACGETVSTSLGGMVASTPESRQLRARVGRVRALEAVPTQVGGRAALVVGEQALGGGAAIELIVAADTLRPITLRTIG